MKDTIEHHDLSYIAYTKLKNLILTNQIQPGEKIRQEVIAKTLGVSRTPLHKAFQMLENEMLVVSRPRYGYYVKEVEPQEAIDAFECREAIEGIAARRLCEKITKAQVNKFKKLWKPFENDIEHADIKKYAEADQVFHNDIVQLSGNKILEKLELLGNVLVRTYQKGLVRPPKETYAEHMAIVDAFEKRDPKLAEISIKDHLKKSRDVLVENLKDLL